MSQLDPLVLDQLAGDYVLGSLGADERAYVNKLLRANVEMQQRVRAWENRLNPLALVLPPVTPPPHVWQAIEQRIAPARPAGAVPGRWFAGDCRRTVVLAAGGLLLALSALLPFVGGGAPQGYVGILAAAKDARPALQASAPRRGHKLRVRVLQAPALVENRVLILWALPDSGPPRRIAVIDAAQDGEVNSEQPVETVLDGVSMLAVSAEPTYAAATSLPHGDYVLKGPCVRLDD